jgi:hypothetical protein
VPAVKPSPFFLGTLFIRRGLSIIEGFICIQIHLFYNEEGGKYEE